MKIKYEIKFKDSMYRYCIYHYKRVDNKKVLQCFFNSILDAEEWLNNYISQKA